MPTEEAAASSTGPAQKVYISGHYKGDGTWHQQKVSRSSTVQSSQHHWETTVEKKGVQGEYSSSEDPQSKRGWEAKAWMELSREVAMELRFKRKSQATVLGCWHSLEELATHFEVEPSKLVDLAVRSFSSKRGQRFEVAQ